MPRNLNVFLGGFPAELPIFDSYRKSLSLSQEFKMDLGLEVAAKMFLQRVANQTQAQVFVAVHVRRMDYSVWLKAKVNGRLLSKLYFIEAMNAFRAKYRQNTVVFVLASDDKEWCRQMFADVPDVVFTPKYQTLMKRGEFDMAILAQCNHSIIRY